MKKISNLKVTPTGVEKTDKSDSIFFAALGFLKIGIVIIICLGVSMILTFGLVKLFLTLAQTI